MAVLRDTAIAAAFEVLWALQLPRLARRLSQARGVIFALNRVLPDEPADFSPNAALQVTPDYLDFVIRRVRKLGLDIVDLDEGIRRIESNEAGRKFVVLSFDGAYRDNLGYALPVLRHHQCPFTLYVPTALVDGVGEAWQQAVEEIVSAQNALAVTPADGETFYLPSATTEEKYAAYDMLLRQLRAMPEAERVRTVRELARQYGFDLERQCRELVMDWSELRAFASDQLCTIGTQTVHCQELAKLTAGEARIEIDQSMRIIKAQFGKAPLHLSYPDGSASAAGPREFGLARDLGLRSAVTTQPGGLYARHRNSLHALPRVVLNGRFQAKRYVDVLASPALFPLAKL